ncbi:glycosyltransferase family 2 protein [Oleiagrimonas soli]|uniref:Undecaprenyl-phosphate 4-deoxy-4-formamido-L-arabinose transferase n=1 Tax=Oleiagrimonas soli TaxID=1543381 RepID=A0A841KQH8_9GAMM|nr:glycosyltransferase family 2 protein [Oleiagrimonas soli]MBB6184224.1 undecaprenyl-phosphate 4-deoxy-4-formamido-L-arabinose transferase [Oleiagrimonas soli]
MTTKPVISVVVPVFRSKATLNALYDRVRNVLDDVASSWEIILVDDASNDGTFEVMLALHEHDSRVKLVRFARNTGQHHATLCGLQRASGDYAFTLDDDLQNPPEEIPRFIEKMEEGYDMVIGKIVTSKKHSAARNLSSRIVQWMVSRILGKPRDLALSSYRGMTRRAASNMGAFTGAHAYLPALIFASVPIDRITNLSVPHNERAHGRSTYSPGRLIKLASYLLINHSYLPLRFMVAWGIILSVASLLYAVCTVSYVLLGGHMAAGWPSLAVLISFLCGNILLFMGIVGEYVGRLVEEHSRPQQFPIFETHD